jgi:uncharacterized SAM-binding protein YcdF (DUF218 family)
LELNSQPSTIDSQPTARKWPRRLLWLAAFCFLFSAFCFVFRAPLLRATANAWIIDAPVTHADAIIVLGGGLEYRPFAAAHIYSNLVHRNSALPASQHVSISAFPSPVILITQPELPPTAQMGLTVPEFVTARQVLLKLGVPENAIQMLGTNVTSTRDEALALKTWLTEHHAHSVVIPTDIFHTRRVRWIFQKALRGSRAEVHVAAVEVPRYTATNWWHHEEGLIAFQNEVIKFGYYRLKY